MSDGAEAAHATLERHALRDVLRLAGFRRLLLVRFPSTAADGVFQVGAATFLLFALDPLAQTSAAEVARILVVTALPFTLAGPFAGVFVDRWRRQRILLWSNVLRSGIILAGLPLASRFALDLRWGPAAFYVALLLAITVNRFFLVTVGAVVPKVVPGDALVPANAIASTGGSIMVLAGASAGGAVAAWIGDGAGGPEVTVLLAVALYLYSVWAASRLPADMLGPERDGPLPPLRHAVRETMGELLEGLRLTVASRRAWAPIVAFSLLRLNITAASIAGLLVFRNVYGGGSGAVSLVLVAFGIGVFVGAVLVTVADRRVGIRSEVALRVGLVITGVPIIVLSPGLRPVSLVAMSGLMGVGFGFAKIATDTLIQSALPDRYRGRLFTAYDIVVNVAFVSGGVLAAVLLPTAEAAEQVYIAAGLVLVATALLSRPWLGHLPPPVDVETWDDLTAPAAR